MILGVGADVVDIERFAAMLVRAPLVRERLFTPAERHLPTHSLAARFAAKEAVAKCMGAPAGLRWLDAEVVVADGGAPLLVLRATVAQAAAERGISSWHVSLSHDGGLALAFVVAEGRTPQRRLGEG